MRGVSSVQSSGTRAYVRTNTLQCEECNGGGFGQRERTFAILSYAEQVALILAPFAMAGVATSVLVVLLGKSML